MTGAGERDSAHPAIMLSAGEASGDAHGAALCRALRTLFPRCRLFGMGGTRMAEAGMDLVADVTADAVVGGSEALGRLPRLWQAYRRLRSAFTGTAPPEVLVLIDFPEFNLQLARAARRAGIPVVYFIPPQIWAWRAGRIVTIRRLVSLVLVTFRFETELYRRAHVPVRFVGHPVLDALASAPARDVARRELGIDGERLTVALFPGSRREEVARVLPVMWDAAGRIARARPDARFVLALAPTIGERGAGRYVPPPPALDIVGDRASTVLRAADLAMVASGTATLEAAVLGTPMVVCYRVSLVSELLGRLLIRVPWINLVNLTLGRAAVPELYQAALTGEHLAKTALNILTDARIPRAQREAFLELRGQLGESGVGLRAARLIAEAAGAAR